jgi:hypothetical protein
MLPNHETLGSEVNSKGYSLRMAKTIGEAAWCKESSG